MLNSDISVQILGRLEMVEQKVESTVSSMSSHVQPQTFKIVVQDHREIILPTVSSLSRSRWIQDEVGTKLWELFWFL